MQDRVYVNNNTNKISGTLKYLANGDLVDNYGPGNFVALKFQVPEGATSVKVGLDPSEGTGLVEIIDDPDKNGAFKVTNKNSQVFKIVTSYGEDSVTKEFDLKSLVTLEA